VLSHPGGDDGVARLGPFVISSMAYWGMIPRRPAGCTGEDGPPAIANLAVPLLEVLRQSRPVFATSALELHQHPLHVPHDRTSTGTFLRIEVGSMSIVMILAVLRELGQLTRHPIVETRPDGDHEVRVSP